MSRYVFVCPARAGMIRGYAVCGHVRTGLPRTRGDDPAIRQGDYVDIEFAPHARG